LKFHKQVPRTKGAFHQKDINPVKRLKKDKKMALKRCGKGRCRGGKQRGSRLRVLSRWKNKKSAKVQRRSGQGRIDEEIRK